MGDVIPWIYMLYSATCLHGGLSIPFNAMTKLERPSNLTAELTS